MPDPVVAPVAPQGQAAPAPVVAAPVAAPAPVVAAPQGQAAPAPVVAPAPVAPVEGQAPEGTQIQTPDWMKPFSPEAQDAINKSGWKTPDEILKSYSELRAKVLEKGLIEPAADAPAAEWNAYNKARGRPELATEYAFSMPKDLPPDLPYDAAFAESFKNWAYDAGLSKAQAAALHEKYVNQAATAYKSGVENLKSQVNTTHAELIKSWGAPETESYRKNVEMATRAITNLDPDLNKALKSVGLMASDGTVLNASIAKALAKAGERLYSEDNLYGAGQRNVGSNPWEKGKENLTRQGEIFKTDPERARAMQRAAGLKVTL